MYGEDRADGSGVEERREPEYEEMAVEELRERAAAADVEAREEMNREQLVWALRGD